MAGFGVAGVDSVYTVAGAGFWSAGAGVGAGEAGVGATCVIAGVVGGIIGYKAISNSLAFN